MNQNPRNYGLVINKIYNSSKRHTLLLSPSIYINSATLGKNKLLNQRYHLIRLNLCQKNCHPFENWTQLLKALSAQIGGIKSIHIQLLLFNRQQILKSRCLYFCLKFIRWYCMSILSQMSVQVVFIPLESISKSRILLTTNFTNYNENI